MQILLFIFPLSTSQTFQSLDEQLPHMCSCPQWEAPRRRTHGWIAAKGMWALWGSPWVKGCRVGKRHCGGVAEESWDGLTPDVLCHLALGVSCRGNSCLILEGPSQVIQAPWSLFSIYTAPEQCTVLVSRVTEMCGTYLCVTRLARSPQEGMLASWMEASLGSL